MPDNPQKNIATEIKEKLFIMEVPSYGNSIFYSLGFLALTCFAMLIASGVVMIFFGPAWWLTNFWGIFFRSIHLWSVQAFISIIILHGLVVFSTSGFKSPRRLTWILGAIMFILVLAEAEFGYGLRGDFSSQYRALQGADFFNGAFLGKLINTLNYAQVYGLHIIYIPFIILALVSCHYFLVKFRGIAKPYRQDIAYTMVSADHTKLFVRGGVLATLIVLFAFVFPSPFVAPASIGQIANDNPPLVAQTLMQEFMKTSNTATYLDSIDPYTYDTRAVYISSPYEQYIAANTITDELTLFNNETPDAQKMNIDQAMIFFADNNEAKSGPNANPLISVINSLVAMARSGKYESTLNEENQSIKPAYSLRFLADTGVLDDEASQLHITTDQWGMMREENGIIPPGAWWLAPIGILNHTILANDDNGDRDGAGILGILVLLLILFPYIPYINRLPEKLHVAEIIWKR